MSSHTQIVVTPTFTCSNCGGRFSYRHSCPAMPWPASAPLIGVRP